MFKPPVPLASSPKPGGEGLPTAQQVFERAVAVGQSWMETQSSKHVATLQITLTRPNFYHLTSVLLV